MDLFPVLPHVVMGSNIMLKTVAYFNVISCKLTYVYTQCSMFTNLQSQMLENVLVNLYALGEEGGGGTVYINELVTSFGKDIRSFPTSA